MLSLLLLLPLMQAASTADVGTVLDVGVALTMEHRLVVHNARILINPDGRIGAVGRQAEVGFPQDWHHLEYPNSFAWPGGIDIHSHTHTGGWEDINDMVHPDNPELRTLDTLVPNNPLQRMGRAGGVTLVNAIPGSGTNLSGAGTLVKLKPSSSVDDVVFRFPGTVKVAQGYNPERRGDLGGSRMGMWWMLRWYLDRGRQVAEEGTVEQNPDVASLVGVFQHRYPILVHTAGARDTFGTVRMFQVEAGVPVVVSHGSFNGFMVGKAIAALQTPLNIGPRNFDFNVSRNQQFRGLVEAYENAGNTDISVQTDAPVIPQEEFAYQASLAERLGCSTWIALESLNVKPARQVLVDDQVGRLVPGLQADIVVSTGQPLDPRAAVELVLIEGEICYDMRQGQLY